MPSSECRLLTRSPVWWSHSCRFLVIFCALMLPVRRFWTELSPNRQGGGSFGYAHQVVCQHEQAHHTAHHGQTDRAPKESMDRMTYRTLRRLRTPPLSRVRRRPFCWWKRFAQPRAYHRTSDLPSKKSWAGWSRVAPRTWVNSIWLNRRKTANLIETTASSQSSGRYADHFQFTSCRRTNVVQAQRCIRIAIHLDTARQCNAKPRSPASQSSHTCSKPWQLPQYGCLAPRVEQRCARPGEAAGWGCVEGDWS